MTALQYMPLILSCVVLNTTSQILLKKGMNAIGYFDFHWRNVTDIGLQIITSFPIIGGLSCHVASFIIWLLALSRMDVSLAYPLSSLGYIMTALAGYYILQEDLSIMKISGIVIIMLGVYCVSRG